MTLIDLTDDELYWIERTADIESSIAMKNFFSLVSGVKVEGLTEKEKEFVQKIGSEHINLYTSLKQLRCKLEVLRNNKATENKK